MIKRMLSKNGRILRDTSHDNTNWLKRPELKVKEMLNW